MKLTKLTLILGADVPRLPDASLPFLRSRKKKKRQVSNRL